MRSSTRSTLAALLAGLICLAGSAAPLASPTQRPVPESQAPARPASVALERPRTTDTLVAAGGGLLVLVLAGVGLTITFRSLLQDMRGRRHRYRRRTRREPRGA